MPLALSRMRLIASILSAGAFFVSARPRWSTATRLARADSSRSKQTRSSHTRGHVQAPLQLPRRPRRRRPRRSLCPQPPPRRRPFQRFVSRATPCSAHRPPVVHLANPDRARVALVCGGGSGHEPSHSAFVGGRPDTPRRCTPFIRSSQVTDCSRVRFPCLGATQSLISLQLPSAETCSPRQVHARSVVRSTW